MAIQDSDPERRNLVLTSIAFIIFYLADGQVTPGAITLQVVSVTFKNVLALKIFAWVMLCWFGLRYWQTHHMSYENAYRDHLNEFGNSNESGAIYIEKTFKLKRVNDCDGFFGHQLLWHGGNNKLHIKYSRMEGVKKKENGSIAYDKRVDLEPEELIGFYGILLRLQYFWSFAIKSPGFTSYAVPYILFASAIVIHDLKEYGIIS